MRVAAGGYEHETNTFSNIPVTKELLGRITLWGDDGADCSAFAVSASFILADHLAFTLAFEPSYLLPMTVGKIVSGILAVIFALVIYKRTSNKLSEKEAA